MITAFGAVGSLILLVAWLNEVYQIHKSKDVEAISLRFLLVYLAATILLLIHSAEIGDNIFIWLNMTLVVITLIEIDIVVRKKAKMPRQKRASRPLR